METYARDDRDFNGPEVEALLRTNGTKRLGWITPADGYVNGNYKRSDGVTGVLTGNKLAIQSSKWTDALTKDQAASKPAQEIGRTNTVDPNYALGSSTNAASYSASATNAGAAGMAATNAP